MESKGLSWKLAVVYSIGFVPTMGFFLFTRHKLKGYLEKSDWMIAGMVIMLGSISVFLKAYLDNRNKQGTDSE
jgi:hypothetical protein